MLVLQYCLDCLFVDGVDVEHDVLGSHLLGFILLQVGLTEELEPCRHHISNCFCQEVLYFLLDFTIHVAPQKILSSSDHFLSFLSFEIYCQVKLMLHDLIPGIQHPSKVLTIMEGVSIFEVGDVEGGFPFSVETRASYCPYHFPQTRGRPRIWLLLFH